MNPANSLGCLVSQCRLFLFLIAWNFSSTQVALTQEWPHVGGDAGGMKYSPLDQINRNNV
jgi:hypothetical protein